MSSDIRGLEAQIAYAVQDEWPVTEIAKTFGISRDRASRIVIELGGKPWSKSAGGKFRLSLRGIA